MANDGGTTWVAGVDGCRGGWLVVLRPLDDPSAALAQIVPAFADVLAMSPRPAVIAVDMPIGLPDRVEAGGRQADSAARAVLGKRRSSVFAVPSRSAVMQTDYARACQVAAATSNPPRKVAQQCFHIFKKIREIDEKMTRELQDQVKEVHPEVAFWALNQEQPLEHAKRTMLGLDLRRTLLTKAGYDCEALARSAIVRVKDAGRDDLLDAAACSWTAARIARNQARCFPEEPGTDVKGLRMEIWC